jgi:hypothetical protein
MSVNKTTTERRKVSRSLRRAGSCRDNSRIRVTVVESPGSSLIALTQPADYAVTIRNRSQVMVIVPSPPFSNFIMDPQNCCDDNAHCIRASNPTAVPSPAPSTSCDLLHKRRFLFRAHPLSSDSRFCRKLTYVVFQKLIDPITRFVVITTHAPTKSGQAN